MTSLSGLRIAGAIDNKAAGGGGTAASQVTVDAGTNTTEFVNPSTLASASTVSRVANIFINGAFDVWQRSANDTGVTTALKYVSDRWYVVTGAGTLANVQRSTTVRSGALSKYSLEMVGATGVTVVNIGQRIESMYSARYKRTIAFSGYIFNGSGAAFTPILYAITPNAVDNFTGTVIRNGGGSGENLQSCADNAWTKVTWSADVSGYTNIDNGLGITLEIPSGSLVASDTVRFAEMNLVPGSAFTPIEMSDPVVEYDKCQRYCELLGSATGLEIYGTGQAAGTTRALASYNFKVEKRVAPTVVLSAASDWAFFNQNVTAFVTWVTIGTQLSKWSVLFDVSGMAASLGGAGDAAMWGPNATAAAKMTFSAEL